MSPLKVDGGAGGAIRTAFIDFKATVEVDEVIWEALGVITAGALGLLVTETDPLEGKCCCGFLDSHSVPLS